jgi:hypothetical protein
MDTAFAANNPYSHMVFQAGPDQWLPLPPPTTPEAIKIPIIAVKATIATERKIALFRQVCRSSSSILDRSSSSLSLIFFLLYNSDKYKNSRSSQCRCCVNSVKMKTEIVKHIILLAGSAFNHVQILRGKPVRQFLVLEAVLVAAAAKPDDLVHIVR